ncbi:MAG: tryptophan--tRNA ligase [Nanoarchaeota archaeon]
MNIEENMTSDAQMLIERFGAEPVKDLKEIPECYTFQKGLIYSHRDFDKFFEALKKGKKCAIVSGLNPSGTLHIGHKIVFDTNLFFQKKYGIPVFIPLSEDETYVTGKVKSQSEGLQNALKLAKELLAYGFDPKKTYFIIDQVYTNIYNLAIKYSIGTNLSTIKRIFGYELENNPGLFFYPVVQTAHILLPTELIKAEYILVPIGPDEDTHIRISREIAQKFKLNKPAITHSVFLPGLTGTKMSASKPETAIFLSDDEKTIRKKIMSSFSGGQETISEHKKKGGNPSNDIACIYLSKLFYDEKQSNKLISDYSSGKLLSSEVKGLFADEIIKFVNKFQKSLIKVKKKDLDKCILKNR